MTPTPAPTPVPLRLPPGAELYNFIYRSTNPAYLVQDIATVRLSNGFYIDAGWFPEHDPNGAYQVRVFYETPDRLMGQKLTLRSVDELVQALESLSWHYSREFAASSSSRTSNYTANVA
jgi:hypothetical protein